MKLTEDKVKAIEELLLANNTKDAGWGDYCLKGNFNAVYGSIELTKLSSPAKPSSAMMPVRGRQNGILWTDLVKRQPYDRQGILYVPTGFSDMRLVAEAGDVREFHYSLDTNMHYNGPYWRYNDYHGYVDFLQLIPQDKILEVMAKLIVVLDRSIPLGFQEA